MSGSEQDAWVTFLEHDVLHKFVKPEGMVYEVTVKIQQTGLFAVVKVTGPFGYKVGFVGARGLRSLAGKIRSMITGDDAKWQEDKFRKT